MSIRYLPALLFAACVLPVSAGLPVAIDGSWYSPRQPGHGLLIERVDDGRALLFWQVYDRTGRPLSLVVDAAVDGQRMHGDALAPHGMRFGDFDPLSLQLPRWGSIALVFDDCAHARLDYDAVDPAYGRGSIALTRLLPLRDAACSLDVASDLASLAGARVAGEFEFIVPADLQPLSGTPEPERVDGVIGPDGGWHAAIFRDAAATGLRRSSGVLVGTRLDGLPARPRHRVTWYPDEALCDVAALLSCGGMRPPLPPGGSLPHRFDLEWRLVQSDDLLVAAAIALPQPSAPMRSRLHLATRGSGGQILSPRGHARSFPVQWVGPSGESIELRIDLSAQGDLRIDHAARTLYAGRITAIDAGGFDFELMSSAPSAAIQRGRGQMRHRPTATAPLIELQLIGHDGRKGLALRSIVAVE